MANDEIRPEADATELLLIPESCLSCGGAPRWESICDQWGERWLASCDCGRIETFFPDRRQRTVPRDPLALFLQGHLGARRPPTPPWIRLFLHSVQGDQPTHWRHSPDACETCSARTTLGLLAWPQPSIAGLCTVCLNCGYTVSSYSDPLRGSTEPPLVGSTWAPACAAVQRLRDCVRASRHTGGVSDEELAA
jgi:hypothetical protein